MGRLIDADKLKADLEKAISKNEDMDCLDFLRVASVIDAQPTAYDPDKVVEQLEEIRVKKTCNKEKCDTKELCRICVVDDAIEIVKQVGVSDDVCEWIKYDYRTICPKNHDANNPYWRIPDNTDKLKYCPYCGKKIKVVE